MIAPGRARRRAPPGLDWHVRLAAARRRAVRARRAAWSALAVALPAVALALLVGRPSPGVAALLAVVAALGAAAVPVRDAERWARDWIAGQRGLGYETSLEAPGRDDPFGFWARSRERTTLALRDAEAPPASRWWLPPTVALALLLAAAQLVGPVGPVAPGAERSPAGRTATPAEPEGGSIDGAAAGAEQDAGDAGGTASAPPERREAGDSGDAAPAPQARDEGDSEARDADGSGDGGASGAAGGSPVERFLRDLDDAETDGDNPFDPVTGSDRGSQGANDGSEVDVGARPPASSPDAGEPSGASSGRADEPGDGTAEGSGNASDRTDAGARDGSGQSGQDAGTPDASDPEGGSGGEGGAPDGTEQGSAPGEGRAGVAEAPEAGGEGAALGEGQAPEEAGLTEGDDGGGGAGSGSSRDERSGGASGSEGAGASPSTDGSIEALPGAPDGPARRLPGERDEGPVPVVGSVRGSGAAPDALPDGRAATPGEARSAERAAEEQGLPGAYREIIRRYFR